MAALKGLMPINQDQLLPNETLAPDEMLFSRNGRYVLIYQRDANLVLYKNDQNRISLWASNTAGQPPNACIMQNDGNLVIYLPGGKPIWASNTGQPGSRLVVQDDGNVVIYQQDGRPLWATNTVQQLHAKSIPDFIPSKDGFHFDNRFPSIPLKTIRIVNIES